MIFKAYKLKSYPNKIDLFHEAKVDSLSTAFHEVVLVSRYGIFFWSVAVIVLHWLILLRKRLSF